MRRRDERIRGAHATRMPVAATRRDGLSRDLGLCVITSDFAGEKFAKAGRLGQHASRVRSPIP